MSDEQQAEAKLEGMTAQVEDDEKTLQEAGDRLAKAYTGGRIQTSLPTVLIDLLLNLAAQVVEDCLKDGTPPDRINRIAKRGGLLVRRQVRRRVEEILYREQGPGAYNRNNGDNVVRALLECCAQSNDQDVARFIKAARVGQGS